ncbi:hypothetical protein PULV_a0971 [Pseudoalteromonas ulvae UL12]|uniref:Uncharacterized protein n=1 Tax=Pseudoalteromonas ulvae TaxID=107327 RepID=A0A244CS37_PSEDV|nr:hypothetical protein [Pseudoalteromonas ulvae]MBE0363520.1 hypothetical protein [Pseudoalteromonas ulvae UL12]OUL58388.1 hypothetical protein B1199_08635 [Pseudoalteromonas ulvae]
MSDHPLLPDNNAAELISHLQQKLKSHQAKQAALEEEVSAFQLVSNIPLEQESALTEQDKQAVVDMLKAIEYGEIDGVTRLK